VSGRRLTAWARARPQPEVLCCWKFTNNYSYLIAATPYANVSLLPVVLLFPNKCYFVTLNVSRFSATKFVYI
jgi:hypothetical protein